MALRSLRCAIEEVVNWHPQLFLEPHVVASVAVMKEYADSPAVFEVECENIKSRWLRKVKRFALEVGRVDRGNGRQGRSTSGHHAVPAVG